MRKFSVLLYFLLLACVAQADPVTREQAQAFAESYFSSYTLRDVTMRSMEAVGSNGTVDYYIINFQPQGWAIISGDDHATPIIGYSKTGSLSTSDMPENMRGEMSNIPAHIRSLAHKRIQKHPNWSRTEISFKANGESVDPLIKVHWDQPAPFNKYCPMGKALVGCVAVAMSQAMSVQRYPDRPRGSHSYRSAEYGTLSINFDEEKAYNWDDIMSGANNYDEVARLLMHAGMSVSMDYGEDGSGVSMNRIGDVANALMNNFKYPSGVRAIVRATYDGDWNQLVKNELNAGRVVVYNGVDSKKSSGHSFCVDGFDSEGRFHVNWGWSGHGEAYFTLNGLGYQGDFYDANHVIVIGIGAPNQKFRSISLSNTSIEESLPAGSVVGRILVNNEEVDPSYSINVHGTYSRTAGGFQSVPFTFENGLLKTTQALTQGKTWTVEITVSEGATELTQGFVINVTGKLGLAEATSVHYDRTTKTFTVSTKNNVSYVLRDNQGAITSSGEISPVPQLDIPLSMLSDGSNKLTLTSASESITLTIKK